MGAGTPLRLAGAPGPVEDGEAGHRRGDGLEDDGLGGGNPADGTSADGGWRAGAPADDTLVEVVRAAVAGAGAPGRGVAGGWGAAFDSFWCTVRPPEPHTDPSAPPVQGLPIQGLPVLGLPVQGWKIHVSAASAVAVEVLSAVATVVAEDPCVFRFAADRDRLHQLNSHTSERGSAGKFITLYPAGEAQFRRLAEELHRATEGLPGPVVLSDRPYAPGSRVHYRYGAFGGRAELGNDGAYRSILHGPAGERTEDVRGASYRCPPWAVDPVEGRGSTRPTGTAGRPRGGGVLIADRYALTAAVRHGTKGGVFLGTDTRTGAKVVVKQARAHIEVDRAGTDARTALRHEARLLADLAGTGPARAELTARPLELVEQGDSLLLVQEYIPGQPLGSWVAARLTRDGAPDVRWDQAGPMALALVDLLARVHATGLVLRDLAPGNVMVRPDGSLRLIDLELACVAGTVGGTAGTPGYRAPEQPPALLPAQSPGRSPEDPLRRGHLRAGLRAEPTADLFALGGLFFLLATGHDPLLPEDLPSARPVAERLGRWLALAARDGVTARRLTPIILGLRAQAPGDRWPLERVREVLRGPGLSSVTPPAAPVVLERALLDGLRHLTDSATPHRPDRLWPAVPAGQRTDPCNVQHGAAGVLAVLARALATAPAPGADTPAGDDPDTDTPAAVPGELRARIELTARQAAAWIERRCAAEPTVLPGLHFGRSGPAWALLDAAEVLGDRPLADRARRLAEPIPADWPNPDICHGAAGAGFLRLRLGDQTAALAIARSLLAAAEEEPYGTVWPVPKAFDSSLAGITQLGYAHGVAGVGAFLLAAFRATGAPELLVGAERAARTLTATARFADSARDSDGAAWWPQSAGDPAGVRLTHWCSGSSGVGSFLVRLWQVTGDPALRDLAVAAGRAVLEDRWHSGASACHGLAGNGEYLLDLAQATGEERFRAGATELAHLLVSRAAVQGGLLVLPDETGTGCAAGYGTGTAGALAFLLRLLHGGPRIWLDPLDPLPPAAAS